MWSTPGTTLACLVQTCTPAFGAHSRARPAAHPARPKTFNARLMPVTGFEPVVILRADFHTF